MKERATAAAPDINSRIARRVRQLRAQLGMTLDDLAAKSEVSRSMLSLVERGESSPTAVVLEKIATGLGIALAGLFDDTSAPASPLSRRTDRTPWRDPQSGYVRRNISPANYPSPVQIVEVMLPAGALASSNRPARAMPSPVAIFSSTTAVGLLSPRSTSDSMERLTSHLAAS